MVTPESFLEELETIERELRAAQGITGSIRLPEIGRLLAEAEVALSVLAEQADQIRQQLLDRSEVELDAEGKEAHASFEIGESILQRDLERLNQVLPAAARSWADPSWSEWEPATDPEGWVRLGVRTEPRLSETVPVLIPATCGPGILLEGGSHRDLAIDGVRSLVLRYLAALPPGMARFTFIDAKGLGEAIAPFLALGDHDETLVEGGVHSIDHDIEEQLEELTRHVEWVIEHCLQGRHQSLDEYHEAMGEVVEPYRFVVVLDHPTGLTDRASTLLRSLIESGPRCGVTTLVVKAPRSSKAGFGTKGLPTMLTFKSSQDGLVLESSRTGRWLVLPDAPPLLSLSTPGEVGIFERVITAIGSRSRVSRNAPVTTTAMFELVAEARRRSLTDGLPASAGEIDPDDPTSWWSGDAGPGLGIPFGRTPARRLVSLWFDDVRSGALGGRWTGGVGRAPARGHGRAGHDVCPAGVAGADGGHGRTPGTGPLRRRRAAPRPAGRHRGRPRAGVVGARALARHPGPPPGPAGGGRHRAPRAVGTSGADR